MLGRRKLVAEKRRGARPSPWVPSPAGGVARPHIAGPAAPPPRPGRACRLFVLCLSTVLCSQEFKPPRRRPPIRRPIRRLSPCPPRSAGRSASALHRSRRGWRGSPEEPFGLAILGVVQGLSQSLSTHVPSLCAEGALCGGFSRPGALRASSRSTAVSIRRRLANRGEFGAEFRERPRVAVGA
jgi:hypothetical protein